MSLARNAEALQRDFRSTANQLRQERKVVRVKSQSSVDAANTLDRLAATVKDCSPATNWLRKILIVVRHAELLRHVAFTGANHIFRAV